MASAWGDSWGSAWGDSWGEISSEVEEVVVVQRGGGGRGKSKKKRKIIRYGDFQTQEDYQAALKAELVPVVPEVIHAEEDEDEIIIHVLMHTLH